MYMVVAAGFSDVEETRGCVTRQKKGSGAKE